MPALKNPQSLARGMSASAIVDGLIRKRRRTIDDQVAVKKQHMESLLRKPEIYSGLATTGVPGATNVPPAAL